MSQPREGLQYQIVCLLMFFLLLPTDQAKAQSDTDDTPADGLSVTASLKHQVVIPQIIYFRVGSTTQGDIDEVTIDIAKSFTTGNSQSFGDSSIPLGNSIPINATDNGSLGVELWGNIGTLNISAAVNNTNGLADGTGNFIPWDQISTQSDDTDFPAPDLSSLGTPANIAGNSYSGKVVKRTASWTYSYKNEYAPAPGTYTGRISYTASAP